MCATLFSRSAKNGDLEVGSLLGFTESTSCDALYLRYMVLVGLVRFYLSSIDDKVNWRFLEFAANWLGLEPWPECEQDGVLSLSCVLRLDVLLP